MHNDPRHWDDVVCEQVVQSFQRPFNGTIRSLVFEEGNCKRDGLIVAGDAANVEQRQMIFVGFIGAIKHHDVGVLSVVLDHLSIYNE